MQPTSKAKEHPLYAYLKSQCPPTINSFDPSIRFYSPIKSGDVAWNWETFLVNHEGKVVRRAPPPIEPNLLESDIEVALQFKRDAEHAVVG
jgi:glutathione peroxidase-family protein